jgi:hypothetical protein
MKLLFLIYFFVELRALVAEWQQTRGKISTLLILAGLVREGERHVAHGCAQ